MRIRVDCPRCRKPLAVPKKKIGSYVHCPQCGGRFWVADPEASGANPAKSSGAGEPAEAGHATSDALATAPHVERPPQPGPVPRDCLLHGTTGTSIDVSTADVLGPDVATSLPPAQKVARLITADTVESSLKAAEDGRLPELQLKEPGQSDHPAQSGVSIPSWLLALLLCLSVAMSAALVLVDLTPQDPASRQRAQQARRIIEEEYFVDLNQTTPLEPHQVQLREARRAASAGDVARERECYRKVLAMLRAERGEADRSLTGSQARDRALKEQITIILSQR